MKPQDTFPVGSSAQTPITWSAQGGHPNSPTTPMRKSEQGKQSARRGGGKRSYVTKKTVNTTKQRLSERDWLIIHAVARLQLASGQQLQRLYYQPSPAGRRLARLDLARLSAWRILARLDRRVGGVRAGSDGYVFAMDALGQRLVQPDRRRYRPPYTPQPAFMAHALAVSELYVQLRELAGSGELELVRFDAEPASWRRFTGPGGRQIVLKPDAFVIVANGDYENHYFIEVDRGTESLPRIADKVRLYTRYWQRGVEQSAQGVFPEVLWVTPDDRRRTQLLDVVTYLDAEQQRLFGITTVHQATEVIGQGDEPDGARL